MNYRITVVTHITYQAVVDAGNKDEAYAAACENIDEFGVEALRLKDESIDIYIDEQ